MSGPFSRSFPPPRNWQDFERLSFDLYRRKWKTNDADLHGRSGQAQAGVDVYGTDRVEDKFTGVQCKGKDQGYGEALTVQELREEVKKAKTFRPKLDVFVLATTAPNDAKLQEEARKISAAHKKKGLFEVRVTGWTTLGQEIGDYPGLVRKNYPDLAPVDVEAKIQSTVDTIEAEAAETRTVMKSGQVAILAAIERLDPGDPLQTQITTFSKFTEDGDPATALKLLQKLWADNERSASPRSRYRMRANMGMAQLVMGDVESAIASMRAAYAEDPTWPGARSILATAEAHSGNRARAFELARDALADDPTLAQAAAIVVDCGPDNLPTAELEALVPAGLRERPEVLLTLAHRARLKGDKTAHSQFIARAAISRPGDWQIQAARAELLLDEIFAIPGLVATHAVPTNLKPNLDSAIDLLQNAWAQLRKRDNARIGAYVGANLLSALEIAGRVEESNRLLSDAIQIAPSFEPFLRKYAQRMIQADDLPSARKALEAISTSDLEMPDRLMLVQVDLHTGRPDQAIEAARALEDQLGFDKLAEIAAALQIEAAFKAGRDMELIPTVLARWPKSIVLRSLAHNQMKDGDERRAALLSEIEGLAAEINDPIDRMHAADALYAAKQFSAAANMYDGLYTFDQDSSGLQRALRSLFHAGRRREARELLEKLAPPLRQLPQYAGIGVSIYEYSGLLNEANALIEDTLSRDDSLRRRLHWMGINQRLDQVEAIRAWLKDVPEDIAGTPQDRMQLALAEDRYLDSDKSFAIGYRALRDGYDDPQVHLGYMIGLVFTGSSHKHAFKKPSTVEIDCAVILEEKDGSRRLTRIIESLPQPKIERDEIAPNDKLAQQLMGRKVGDEIEIPSLGIGPTIYVVKEIRDKYVEAHFRSLNNFETMFPGHPAFGSFQIDESKGDQKFKPLFDTAKNRAEHGRLLLDAYQHGRTPLMMLSRFSGLSPCDIWEWIVAQPQTPLRTCLGTPDIEAALTRLSNNARAVIDPITLYGLVRLGIAETVKNSFSDLGVVQTTIDLLRRLVHDRNDSRDKPHSTLSSDGERIFLLDSDPEFEGRRVSVAEEALAFAESLTLVPSEADTGVDPAILDLFEDCDPAFLDTIYAAQGDKRQLLSDDALFRLLAYEITGVDGVWTQPSTLFGARARRITGRAFEDVSRALAASDYRFTTIDPRVVLRQLERDEWKVTPALRNIADQIALASNNQDSVIRLLADLLLATIRKKSETGEVQNIFACIFSAFRRAQPELGIIGLANEIVAVVQARAAGTGSDILYRRQLMSSTYYTSPDLIARRLGTVFDRFSAKIVNVLEGAISLIDKR